MDLYISLITQLKDSGFTVSTDLPQIAELHSKIFRPTVHSRFMYLHINITSVWITQF